MPPEHRSSLPPEARPPTKPKRCASLRNLLSSCNPTERGVALSSPVNSVKGEVEVVYGPTGPFLWAYRGGPLAPILEHSGATTYGPTVLEKGFCSGSTLSFSVLEEANRR